MKKTSFVVSLTLIAFLLCKVAYAVTSPTQMPEAISFNQLGTEVDKRYGEHAAEPITTKNGYRLTAKIQALEAEITTDGLTVSSAAKSEGGGSFTIVPIAVNGEKVISSGKHVIRLLADNSVILDHGVVSERFTTSSNGIRQDFIIDKAPSQATKEKESIELTIALKGVTVNQNNMKSNAALLILPSGRKLSYGGLLATDANGKKLSAQMKVEKEGEDGKLCIVVAAKDSVYPITIDPTVSDDDWEIMNPSMVGVNGIVYSLAYDKSTGALYAGGAFTVAGNIHANNIVKWDGSKWSALGSGMSGIPSNFTELSVKALAVDAAGNVYAGGNFTTAGGVTVNSIAKWNGVNWSALGSGMGGAVNALAIDPSGNLYVGGNSQTAGSTIINGIAKWDGTSWSALGSGMDKAVFSLATDTAGNIYAGGAFTTAGGGSANCIAKWNGTSWSALGSGMSGGADATIVYALSVNAAGNVYAGGNFTTAGVTAAKSIAKWDGTSWSALGLGINWDVHALAVDAAGNIYANNYISGSSIAKWDGSNWSALGSGMNDYVNVITIDPSGNLYAGSNRLSKWNGTTWSSLGSGMDGSVSALAVNAAGNVYAGGNFTTIGGVAANCIAKWDGTSWSALGSGLNNSVRALAVDAAGNVYAGGDFTTAGGVAANYIAKWDGTNWSALGSGMSGGEYRTYVAALAVDASNNVYAGGLFTTAGGVAVNYIAKWNGTTWSALSSGMSGGIFETCVFALAFDHSGNLYAGGDFTAAGVISADHIAKWDGANWSALGSGIGCPYNQPKITAIAIDASGNLYAGGVNICQAGGVTAIGIAKWDGTNWSALGNGSTGFVYALAIDAEGNVYAGGDFDALFSGDPNNIAKWDGTNWYPLGSGMSDDVNALVIASSNLYAGGLFATAGGVVSPYIAKAKLPGTGVILSIVKSGSGGGKVSSDKGGIDCDISFGFPCKAVFTAGTLVTLTATPTDGSTFTGWSGGGCSGTDNCTFNITDDVAVTANFDKKTRKSCIFKKALGEGNPKLEYLRDFRDSTLAQSAIGRKVIEIYYNNTDSINAALERSPALQAIARRVLEVIVPMVEKK